LTLASGRCIEIESYVETDESCILMRFRIPPGDIPIEQAARRLGLSVERFRHLSPDLIARGFPSADETTGNYSLDAIDEWRRRRYPRLFKLSKSAKDATMDRPMERLRNASPGCEMGADTIRYLRQNPCGTFSLVPEPEDAQSRVSGTHARQQRRTRAAGGADEWDASHDVCPLAATSFGHATPLSTRAWMCLQQGRN
jgi:hypothetical protein